MHLLKKAGDMNALFKEDEEIEQQRLETQNRLEVNFTNLNQILIFQTLHKAENVLDELYNYAL